MRRPARIPRLVAIVAIVALPAAGCGLFRPAEPEKGTRVVIPVPDYSHPDSCLRYMAIGIGLKDAGQSLYLGALSDGFQAYVDLTVWTALNDATRPQVTDLATEQQFVNGFIRLKPDNYVMTWEQDINQPHDDGSVDAPPMILHRRYTVRDIRARDTLLIAVGYADLTFQKTSSSRWAMTKWQDRVDPLYGAVRADEARTFGYRRLVLQ